MQGRIFHFISKGGNNISKKNESRLIRDGMIINQNIWAFEKCLLVSMLESPMESIWNVDGYFSAAQFFECFSIQH